MGARVASARVQREKFDRTEEAEKGACIYYDYGI